MSVALFGFFLLIKRKVWKSITHLTIFTKCKKEKKMIFDPEQSRYATSSDNYCNDRIHDHLIIYHDIKNIF